MKKVLVLSVLIFLFVFCFSFDYTEDDLLNYYNDEVLDYFHYENYYEDCKNLESEEELIFRLRVLVDNQKYLDYTEARYQMFTYVDNYDGWVDCIYTYDKMKCNTIPNHTIMNCEHSWPKSLFGSYDKKYKYTDLHHLRPSQSRANSIRSNNYYGIVVDIRHQLDDSKSGKDENGYTVFEPVDDKKGDLARGYFYFCIRYKDENLNDDYEKMLRKWHKEDPVDEKEFNRNSRIEDVQGNRNPFIDEPSLVDKISDF